LLDVPGQFGGSRKVAGTDSGFEFGNEFGEWFHGWPRESISSWFW
jgi:hypothetical protein